MAVVVNTSEVTLSDQKKTINVTERMIKKTAVKNGGAIRISF